MVELASSSLRVLPDFLVIGTQKGGTTSLHSVLKAHPDVFMHRRKELHYFDVNFHRGAAWYRSFFPTEAGRNRHRRDTGRNLLAGEASPFYLFHPDVPSRAAELIPDVRLIALLRNPVDRAYSQYQHNVRDGLEPLSFREAILAEAERVGSRMSVRKGKLDSFMHGSYASRGIYIEQIERWYRFFPQEQTLILQSEQFFANPVESLKQVTDFLRIPAFGELDLARYGLKNLGGYESRIEPDLRDQLEAFFDPFNRRLYDRLGVTWRW